MSRAVFNTKKGSYFKLSYFRPASIAYFFNP